MKVQITVVDDGKTYAGEVTLTPTGGPKGLRGEQKKRVKSSLARKPSEAIEWLYRAKFFNDERTLPDTVKQLSKGDYNFNKPSVLMALKSASFLQRRESKGSYRFVQKYPPAE